MNDELKWLIDTSRTLGSDINLVQGTGGNISAKSKDKMIIKSSGTRLSSIQEGSGYIIVDHKKISNIYSSDLLEEEAINITNSAVISGSGKPSIETGFHSFLDKYVLHLHPISLNILLCSKNGKETISSIFNDIEFLWIPYHKVGHKVSMEIKKSVSNKTKLIFLENHGIIVTSDDPDCVSIINEVIKRVENYLKNSIDGFSPFNYETLESVNGVIMNRSKIVLKNSEKILRDFIFPDAAVFSTTDKIKVRKDGIYYYMNFENAKNIDEVLSAHAYLHEMTKFLGGPKIFTEHEVAEILGMESEKYRRKLMGLEE